jgi:hypothetical protein
MKKQLPTDTITHELAQSVFFPKPAGEPAHKPTPAKLPPLQARPHLPPPPPANEQQPPEGEQQKGREASRQVIKADGMLDVMTLSRQDINLKAWQEMIENTETQNSALRLTSEERYAVEDVVSELRRKYGIKTSMNEIARLGLLLLIDDFKKHKKASLIHTVKKA